MPSDIGFENCKATEGGRYRKTREGNSDVTFSYLVNYVSADLEGRVLSIDVDGHFIEMCGLLDDGGSRGAGSTLTCRRRAKS
jgi:hypothetical protein